MVFTIVNRKNWSSINLELFAVFYILVKKLNIFKDIKLEIFNSIETFNFDLQKFDISFMP